MRRKRDPGKYPGLCGSPHTAGALDPSLRLEETRWFPKAGTLLDILKEFQPRAILGIPGGSSSTKARLEQEIQSLVWSTRE